MRIKVQESRLTLQEYDDDYDPKKRWTDRLLHEDQGTGNTPNPSGT
jgi:hypothetical protein